MKLMWPNTGIMNIEYVLTASHFENKNQTQNSLMDAIDATKMNLQKEKNYFQQQYKKRNRDKGKSIVFGA